VTIDIRGVNQRALDVRVSLPREYGSWEGEVRERVRALVERGRIEVSVTRTLRTAGRRARVRVREDIAGAYVRAASTLGRHLGLAGTLSLPDLLRLPDIFAVEEPGSDIRSEEPALWRALGSALRAFDADRRREGANLGRDMRARAATLKRIAARLRRVAPGIDAALRKHAMERIARLADGLSVDPARLAHEVASLAERADFTEELVRLDSHLHALSGALGETGAVGRRVDFLLQEIQRELNTSGAKVADLAVGRLILQGRGEVEKLREQVQNVE